jgi:hypothetical protein
MAGVDIKTHITAFIISSLIFVVGIMTGWFLSKEKIGVLESTISDLTDTIENVEMQLLFLDTAGPKISCDYMISEANRLGEEAGKLGDKVGAYEENRKIEDVSYKETKSNYMSVLIRDWLVLERIKKTCNGSYTTVLFFYKEDCEECEDQGAILSHYKEKLKNNLMIFALDHTLNHTTITAFEKAFNIAEFPSIVVNMENKGGFKSDDEVKDILCTEGNYTICQ